MVAYVAVEYKLFFKFLETPMTAKPLQQILTSLFLLISLPTLLYAANSSFSVSATVAGGDAIYCPGTGGSSPNPSNCGTVSFGTFTGAQSQQQVIATVTTNDPSKNATLTVADSTTPGSNYSLKNSAAPTQTIPLSVQYTDCLGNNYGSTSNSTPISNEAITGSSISGTSPACTDYQSPTPSGTHGVFTFTVPTMATLPQDGTYSETLNVTIGST